MKHLGCRVLVVEDDPNASEITCAILRSLGYSPRAVATVEEALAAIEEEEFCFFVLDQQLPLNAADPKPFVTGGERVTVAARASDPRHAAAGEGHVTPILVLTSHSARSAFVSGLFKRGIDAFVEKDVCDRVEAFSAEVREMLVRAGRADHAQCAALARRGLTSSSGKKPTVARLAIDGKPARRGRTAIEMNGTLREMQDSRFVILLRAVVVRLRSAEAWTGRDVLGIGDSRSATTQIRQTFAGLVPEEFDVLEGDGRGSFRLHPEVVLARVDFAAIARHPAPAVARIGVEQMKRR